MRTRTQVSILKSQARQLQSRLSEADALRDELTKAGCTIHFDATAAIPVIKQITYPQELVIYDNEPNN